MSKKGLDTLFLHYGVRREDMRVITALCEEMSIEPDWLKEQILKVYHEKKTQNEDLDEKKLKKLLGKALKKM